MISTLTKHFLKERMNATFRKRLATKYGKEKTTKILNRALEILEHDQWEAITVSGNPKKLEEFLQKTIEEINKEEEKYYE